MKRTAILAALALAGCGSPTGVLTTAGNVGRGTPPIVTATDAATASLTIMACPFRPEGAALLAEYLQTLSQQAPIVTATSSGSARMILNLCTQVPTADVVREMARAAAQRPR